MANEMMYAQALRQQVAPQPQPEMLGSGSAAAAAQDIKDRGYKLYVAESQALGETPQTYEEWKAAQ